MAWVSIMVCLAALSASLVVGARANAKDGEPATKSAPGVVSTVLGELVHPKANLPSDAKIALGKQLYWDKRMSLDNTVACVTCHDPKKGWSNGDQFATGVGGKKGGRNSPSVLNSAFYKLQFWDGRAAPRTIGRTKSPICSIRVTPASSGLRWSAII